MANVVQLKGWRELDSGGLRLTFNTVPEEALGTYRKKRTRN